MTYRRECRLRIEARYTTAGEICLPLLFLARYKIIKIIVFFYSEKEKEYKIKRTLMMVIYDCTRLRFNL